MEFTKANLQKKQVSLSNIESMGADAVWHRLDQLDREWDIERVSMLFSSGVAVLQFYSGRNKRLWFFRPQVQIPLLLLERALSKAPVSVILQRLGFRSKDEIQSEREALNRFIGH